jgi:Effector-associated domain 1
LGHRESELCLALIEAYADRDGLANLLYIRLDRNLDHIVAATANLMTTVRVVVDTAEREGWLIRLGAAALADKPDSQPLRAWNRGTPAPAPAAAPAASPRQLMDSSYFDLTAIRDAIHDAMTAPDSQVIGFGVTYPEPKFVEKLSNWLHWYLGPQTEPRGPLVLNPATGGVSLRLEQLLRYRNRLDKVNMVREVVVDGSASAAHIAEFWTRVREEFGGVKCQLVLLFTCYEPDKFPGGITVLPTPAFTKADVSRWAVEVVSRRPEWPGVMAATWATWLCRQALLGDDLDACLLYEAMDDSVKVFRFQTDANQFLVELESLRAG